MDPEVSLLVQCPLGGLAEEQVRAELSPAYDRRPLPGGEDSIIAAWKARRQTQPWLFNAPKFRLHSATLGPPDPGGPYLTLRLGLTSYQDFLGTNWAATAGRLRCQGKADWGDAQAYLADPLGALFPGETPRHQDLAEELVVRELFSSILQEIRDEVNLPLSTLSRPLLLGIARNETSAGRASAEFSISCSLTSEQVKSFYLAGGLEAHESTDIIFMEVQRVRRLQEDSEAWAELCPSAKGAILLYNLVQARPA